MKPIKISISGPRSVGKTTVSRFVAKELGVDFFSTDEMVDGRTQDIGGLDKAIKSGKHAKELLDKAPDIIKEVLGSEEFILDLAGGAISSEKYLDESSEIMSVVKTNSLLIGIFPFKKDKESIEFLYLRERGREHFKDMDSDELREKVKKDYIKVKKKLLEYSDKILYLEGRSSEEISEEIINYIKLNFKG
jgi:shikimate kinase